jgi:hypothetical protein
MLKKSWSVVLVGVMLTGVGVGCTRQPEVGQSAGVEHGL